ncbi:hypothetical protein Tco_0712441 [Tanacetum coccineum]
MDNKAYKKQEKMYYPRFTKVIIHHFLTQDKTVSWRNKIRMHTYKDDYLINTLRFVSAKGETQIYGDILPESLTSPEIKETKAYKTYLVSTEEPTGKSKRVKRPAKKSTKAPTHPSGSGAVKIIPSVTSEGTGVKPGVPNVTEEESSESEAESWGNDEDDSNNKQDSSGEDSDQKNDMKGELVKTPSNDSDDEDETKITDKAEGYEDEEIDYTTSQLYDDVDIRLNEPVDTNKGFVQEEGTDAVMTNVQQENENPKIIQVIEDAHVTLSTVPQKTEVQVTSSSHSSDLAAKFLNFSDIPHTYAEIVSLMDVHKIMKVTTLEQEVAEIKKDPLYTQVMALIDDHLDARLGATKDEFINFLSGSLTMVKKSLEDVVLAKESSQPQSSYEAAPTLTEFNLKMILINKIDKSKSYLAAPKHKECYEGLKKSYDLDKSIFSTYGKVYSLKRSQKDKDEDPFAGLAKGDKSQSKSFGKSVQLEEPEFEVADSNMPQDQEENLGNDDEEPKEKVASKRDWFTKSIQPQEPTDPDWNVGKTLQQGQNQSWLLTLASSTEKPSKTFDELMSTPIDFSAFIMNGLKINNLTQETLLGPAFRLFKGTRSNYAELEYDFKECYKALLENLIGKIQKAVKDMVPNIWVLVKVAYDKHALWGISHWREQRKTCYRYPKEIVIRRADNDLYRFKEGDFPRLRINDIEDMLLLFIQNWLTNLSGNDVFDFEIALRMFTRSLVIQKRVKDLQLGVESYQKKINVTKPETTKSRIRKRDLYTPYQDPQGFIYNIRIEYLPKRRWSTLKKKRANIMIKAIDKQLKERRMMRSLENQNRRDLPRDIPLDSVVVLRYEKRSKSENKGKVPTKMELVLEQTQQVLCPWEASQGYLDIGKLNTNSWLNREDSDLPVHSYRHQSIKMISYEVLKLKNIKKDGYTRFQHQEQYEHVGPEVTRSQEGKRSQDEDKRLCLVDDLKEVLNHIHIKSKIEVKT